MERNSVESYQGLCLLDTLSTLVGSNCGMVGGFFVLRRQTFLRGSVLEWKEDWIWNQMAWVQILALPFTICVTLGKSHNLPLLLFPQL